MIRHRSYSRVWARAPLRLPWREHPCWIPRLPRKQYYHWFPMFHRPQSPSNDWTLGLLCLPSHSILTVLTWEAERSPTQCVQDGRLKTYSTLIEKKGVILYWSKKKGQNYAQYALHSMLSTVIDVMVLQVAIWEFVQAYKGFAQVQQIPLAPT